MTRTIGLMALLSALLASAPAKAAYPVACRNGTTVYLPQAGDPICKQFTCEPVGHRDRYQDVAKRHGLTVGQVWQFEVPEGMGTREHPVGSAPNIAGGWTVVGEYPKWRHIRNSDWCIDTVSEMVVAAKSGRNLQGALRHDIPNLVVVIPSEPNPCLDNLAECGAAYEAKKAEVAATSEELTCWRTASKEWKDGQCVPRKDAENKGAVGQIQVLGTRVPNVIGDLAKIEAARNCERDGKFYRWSDGACLTKAQLAAMIGTPRASAGGGVGWLAAVILFVILLLVLGNFVWSRVVDAAVNTLGDESLAIPEDDGPQVEELRAMVTQVEDERDAAQEEVRAKDRAIMAADERNAALSERARRAEEASVPQCPVNLTALAAQASVLLRRRNVELEHNGERDAHTLAAAVLGQLVAEAVLVWDARDDLEGNLAGVRRGMQEAGQALAEALATRAEIATELAALREEVVEMETATEAVVGSAMAVAATPALTKGGQDKHEATQDERLARLESMIERVRAAFADDLDLIEAALTHPRSQSKRDAGREAVGRLRAAVAAIPPVN